MGDAATLVELLNTAGVIGLLVVVVIGGMRGWYVWAWVYKDALDERDRRYDALAEEKTWWRDTAIRSLELGEAAIRTDEPSGRRHDDRPARRRYLDDLDATERRRHDDDQ